MPHSTAPSLQGKHAEDEEDVPNPSSRIGPAEEAQEDGFVLNSFLLDGCAEEVQADNEVPNSCWQGRLNKEARAEDALTSAKTSPGLELPCARTWPRPPPNSSMSAFKSRCLFSARST
mmetsp:Transcript_45076/g.97910  ORF Transcript_45076/g.97910 Transcript_45076/m.97910 type:complete len:118 (-) Transcript_45076:234-587(-)